MAVFKDEKLEEMQKSLPCVNCKLKDLCRHYGTIMPIGHLPEMFEVYYVCKDKEKFS